MSGVSTEIHNAADMHNKLKIPLCCCYNLISEKSYHYRGRYIKMQDFHRVFKVKDLNSEEEFMCITNKTMEYYLKKKFNQIQLRGINHLKNHSLYSTNLDGRIFVLANGDKSLIKLRSKRGYARWKENHPTDTIDRWKNDINFKMKRVLRSRVFGAMKGAKKSKKTMELLGCDIEFFKKHMENLFEEGMTWQNYGRGGWHVDHIMPCSSFDLSMPEQQKLCFHYTNLQPLWQTDNLTKRNKLPHQYIRIRNKNVSKGSSDSVVTN